MSAAVQKTDTDVAFRVKANVRRRQRALKRTLKELAKLENTRAVFKRGAHEVPKVLVEAIERLSRTCNSKLLSWMASTCCQIW